MSTRHHRHRFSPKNVRVALDSFEGLRSRRAAMEAEEIITLAGTKALIENAHGPVEKSSKADIAYRSLVADLAAATRVSERTVRRWVDDASDLVDRFGDAVVALGKAKISKAHVQVIYETGAGIIEDDARDAFTQRMIALAEERTPAQLRQVAKLAADRAQPSSIDDRHKMARERRRISVFDLSDGMSELTMILPSVLAHAIYDRATRDARSVIRDRTRPDGNADDGALLPAMDDAGDEAHPARPTRPAAPDATPDATPDAAAGPNSPDAAADPDVAVDGRSIDEIRADVVTDLLLTGSASTCTRGEGIDAVTAIVQITVPVLTLSGSSTEPALLAGTGPVDLDTARRLVGNATGWDRVMTSPVDGAVLAVDRYTPTAAMTRHLRARDEHCRFPGCRQPTWRCDLDHTIDHAQGGRTSTFNLAHLCRHHHTLKHASDWTVAQHPGGILEWTSPTGRVYTDRPEPTVRFTPVPDDGPPPPF